MLYIICYITQYKVIFNYLIIPHNYLLTNLPLQYSALTKVSVIIQPPQIYELYSSTIAPVIFYLNTRVASTQSSPKCLVLKHISVTMVYYATGSYATHFIRVQSKKKNNFMFLCSIPI
jgi:hypothetical protein